jgi:[protein-PII] uridylyltransferase
MGLAPELIGQLKAEHQQGLKTLREAYLNDPEPRRLLAERSAQIDAVLRQLWTAHGLPESLALVAVGGYGRGELYPASDIDLLLLLPDEPDAALCGQLEELVGIFWDIGLEVGHSVRTIDTCLQEAGADITVETTLLESRLLTGNQPLFAQFTQALRGLLDPTAFFRAKRLEQDERHQRYQETAYSLEPNCKESPGGLRDLQAIIWIAKACGCGASWQELERHGLITGEEVTQLDQCERLLQDIRIRLHFQTGRREDRLLFDVQEGLAQQLGYQTQPHRRASELMMQVYYRNAKAITQLNTILLQNIGAVIFPPRAEMPPQAINERFAAVQELLDVVDEEVFRRSPSAILESFLLLQQHGELKGMTARTLRALYRARFLIDDAYRANPAHRKLFLALLQSPRGIVHEFRRMNQYGILGRYLPAFGKIVGQMQHDLFHAYTVDQHILQVMRNLRRLTMEEFAHEMPFESRLINAFPDHWLLYLAALFHDIAKGRGGDHSELGTADAAEFCRNHGIAKDDAELVVWLVREHLTMSQIAQKEDISDPETVRGFAERVKDERHLTALYLLTVSDIRGTSPKVWNAWKAQLLEGLYNATRRQLAGGGKAAENTAARGMIQERQQEAMRLLRYFALSDTVHERLWKQLDTVYFLRHSAEEIAWHTRSLHYRIFNDQPIVKARLYRRDDDSSTHAGGLQVMVYTQDQRDLFVRLAGFFARAGFSIVDAKIHTTKHGYALDSFILLDVQERHTDRELISYIEHELVERLQSGVFDAPPTSGRLSRQVRHFPFQPSVSIQPDAKGTQYVLSIIAADRPGLLFTVALALARHGVNLYTAKIATLGERVEDTFLIGGGDLTKTGSLLRLETELLDLLKV